MRRGPTLSGKSLETASSDSGTSRRRAAAGPSPAQSSAVPRTPRSTASAPDRHHPVAATAHAYNDARAPLSSGAPSHISARDSWNTSRDSLEAHPYDVVTGGDPQGRAPIPPVEAAVAAARPSSVAPSTGLPSSSSTAHADAEAVVGADAVIAVTAGTRNEGSLFRQVYNEKLKNSVQSIIHSLTVELPADHVFAQLMADPTTLTYCKVRLAEVVETFLYATQAQQFHNLVAELARLHEEHKLTQQALATARRAQGTYSDGGGSHTVQGGIDYHTPQRAPPPVQAIPAGGGPGADSDPAAATANPMGDEAARQALLSLLEDATRDHELERSRHCLAGPDRLIHVAAQVPSPPSDAVRSASDGRAEANDSVVVGEKVEYLSSVMTELYRSVSGLLSYVDGSLESLDALRDDLARHQQRSVLDADGRREPGLVNTPVGLTRTEHASPASKLEPRVPTSSSSSTLFLSRGGPVAELRKHVRVLLDQLRDAQVQSARALDRLAQDAEESRRGEAAALRALDVAQHALKATDATAASGTQQLEDRLERLKAEHQRALAAEREDARVRIDRLHAQLSQTHEEVAALESQVTDRETLAQSLEAVRQERDRATARAEAAEKALAAHEQGDSARREALQALEKEGAALRRDLDSCEAELLCARVELHAVGLECGYWQGVAHKHEVMEKQGWGRLQRDYVVRAQMQAEAARHQQAQAQLAETAALQKDVARQQAQLELIGLLRSMWADEARLQRRLGAGAGRGKEARASPEVSVDTPVGEDTRDVRERHKVPTTLPGLVTALAYTYAGLQQQQRVEQQRLLELEAAAKRKDERLGGMDATRAELQAALDAQRAQTQELKKELDLLSTNNPMKALLARQEALLASVSAERAVMRDRWGGLNADYIALERRNAELHARCVGKEHENATLCGVIQSMKTSPAKASVSALVAEATPRAAGTVQRDAVMHTAHAGASPATPPSLPRGPAIASVTTPVSASRRVETAPRSATAGRSVTQPASTSAASTPTARAATTTAALTGARLRGSPESASTASASAAVTTSPSQRVALTSAGPARAENVARALLTPTDK